MAPAPRTGLLDRLYPRASEPRLPVSHPNVHKHRVKFFKAAALNFCVLILLFVCLYSYLFGSLFQEQALTYNLQVLLVDYDGGLIGEAVRSAYATAASAEFPTLVEQPPSAFPEEADLFNAVCRTDYWAALFIRSGASQALGEALAGIDAASYNRSAALAYIWNEARYPAVVDSLISTNLQNLSNLAREAYIKVNGTAVLAELPRSDAAALSAFTNPWTLLPLTIQPTRQGTRTVYNTLAVVLLIISDFIFLGTINGLYLKHEIYVRVGPRRIVLIRYAFSAAYSFLGTMLITGIIWAFRAEWNVSGSQYALTWLTFWLFAHCNFLTLDVFTIWIPPTYVTMALISWVIINVTSIVYPFELSSPFYRWAYALPAHAAYDALTDVWSHGCSPHLYYAIPVLFAYELSGLVLSGIGVYKRCHVAIVRAAENEDLDEKIAATLMPEQSESSTAEGEGVDSKSPENGGNAEHVPTGNGGGVHESKVAQANNKQQTISQAEAAKLARQRAEVDEAGPRLHKRLNSPRSVNFGPSFPVFGQGGDDEN